MAVEMSKCSSGRKAGGCLGPTALALLLAGSVFALVGVAGTWGTANFNVAGMASGMGEFTLWEVVMNSHVEVLGTRITMPEARFRLDETLCSDSEVKLLEVENVCGKFRKMRGCTIVAVLASVVALMSAVVACVPSMLGCLPRCSLLERLPPSAANCGSLVAAIFASVAGACALAALITAAEMPKSERISEITAAGPAAICMALLVLCAAVAAALELRGWRASRAADGRALPEAREQQQQKPESTAPAAEGTDAV